MVLGQGMNTEFAFFNSLQYKERNTFQRFEFSRTKADEPATEEKANELLRHSPYNQSTETAKLFLEALKKQSKDFPNLVSPHLGERLPTSWAVTTAAPSAAQSEGRPNTIATAALPLGGRVKVDPWTNQLQMSKSKLAAPMSEAERMSFQITPFAFYLTRQNDRRTTQPTAGVAAKLDTSQNPN
jgi:hypothetical protein